MGVHFETSDEVVVRLLERDAWTLTKLSYSMDTTSRSLRRMIITGTDGEARHLRIEKGRKLSVPDVLYHFRNLPEGSAVRHGMDAGSALAIEDAPRDHQGDAVHRVHADELQTGGDEQADDAYSVYLEQMLEDLGEAAGRSSAALEEAVGDFLGPGAAEEEGDDDAEDLGAVEPPDDECEAGDADEAPPPEANQEVVAAVEAAAEALGPIVPVEVLAEPAAPAASAAVDAPPPASPLPPPPIPPPADTGWEISDVGYVTATNYPPFEPGRRVGLVGYRGTGASIFANCHIHPKCSVSAGIRRHHMDRSHMAEWLLLAEPIDRTAPMEDRLAAGKRHRDLWVNPNRAE